MDLEKTIECIVQEVMNKLNISKSENSKKNALVVMNGSTKDLEQIRLELKKISEEYDLKLIFSEAANTIIDKNIFSNFNIIENFSLNNYESFLDETELIILPLLTKNTCAKLCVGIRDNSTTNLITKAILNEKMIVAVSDSCEVSSNNLYANMLNSNIETLKKYGITFVKNIDLSNYILNKSKNEINFLKEKKIILSSDIKDFKNKNIVVSKTAIITTLANEVAKNNNITFEKK